MDGPDPDGLEVIDVDGDGLPDLVVAAWYEDDEAVWYPGGGSNGNPGDGCGRTTTGPGGFVALLPLPLLVAVARRRRGPASRLSRARRDGAPIG